MMLGNIFGDIIQDGFVGPPSKKVTIPFRVGSQIVMRCIRHSFRQFAGFYRDALSVCLHM